MERGRTIIMDKMELKTAKALYEAHSGNDPVIHCNRIPPWEEISPEKQDQWLATARIILWNQRPEPKALGDGEVDLRKAIEPVKDWYQSDEEEPRPLVDIITDIVADLQEDRAQSLRVPTLSTRNAKLKADLDYILRLFPSGIFDKKYTSRSDVVAGKVMTFYLHIKEAANIQEIKASQALASINKGEA